MPKSTKNNSQIETRNADGYEAGDESLIFLHAIVLNCELYPKMHRQAVC